MHGKLYEIVHVRVSGSICVQEYLCLYQNHDRETEQRFWIAVHNVSFVVILKFMEVRDHQNAGEINCRLRHNHLKYENRYSIVHSMLCFNYSMYDLCLPGYKKIHPLSDLTSYCIDLQLN